MSAPSSTTLQVLTLNCWGLKFVSRNRNERIAALAIQLAKPKYDIIALQEVWVYADYEFLRDNVSARLPHAKFFHSGALGAGLVIFSRFPILTTSVHPYSLNGSPTDVLAGDWIVGKAAASIVIQHPTLDRVQIFNTHLYAKGGEDTPESTKAHRLVNAWEFAKLALQAAQLGHHVIALGDFNCLPTSLPMDIIRDHAGLTDAWTVTHRTTTSASSSSLVSSPSAGTVVLSAADEAIRRYGVTADSPLNSYSTRKALDSHAHQYLGKRLDYVFYRQAIRPSSDEPTTLFLKATQTAVVFTERVPEYDFSFSDHFALECTFEIQETQSHTTPWTKRGTSLSSSTISNSIEALTAFYRFSRSRARRELTICFLCILLLIGLVVGSAWIPATSINPVLVLITIFLAWLATTMLYEGFIFGRWEQNALTTVIEELEIQKKTGEMFRPPGRRT